MKVENFKTFEIKDLENRHLLIKSFVDEGGTGMKITIAFDMLTGESFLLNSTFERPELGECMEDAPEP